MKITEKERGYRALFYGLKVNGHSFKRGIIMANLVTALQGVVATYPNKAAYVFGEDTVTYGQFYGQVEAMAATLEQKGIAQGDHVALVLGNSPAFLISYFAVLARGGVVIPINPTYTPDEMAYILLDGDVKAIVALSPLVAQAEAALTKLPQLRLVISVPYADVPALKRDGDIEFLPFNEAFATTKAEVIEVGEDEVAVILYTSGTTGKPKGALLTHLNLFSNAQSIGEYLEITPEDKALAALPMFHVFCLTVIVNAPLLRGATIVILPKFSPQDVFDLVPKHRVSIFAGVPTMYNFLLQTAMKVPAYARRSGTSASSYPVGRVCRSSCSNRSSRNSNVRSSKDTAYPKRHRSRVSIRSTVSGKPDRSGRPSFTSRTRSSMSSGKRSGSMRSVN